MHPSPPLRQVDEAALGGLVADHPLALICAVGEGRPLAAHAPVLLEGRRLRFHLSRSNAISRVLRGGETVLAVATGPSAYVSPDWYGQDDQVPTWNYLSAEMEGPVRILAAEEAARLLDDLSARFEAALAPKPAWTRHKMSPGRFEAMLAGIVAFEVEVTRLEGVWKLAQTKPAAARAGVIEALEARGEVEMAALMRALTD
ncbi:MAG: FMN-binding negative transcriptional regulator [Caulobacter sp.]|nr:FMN-binding negative transcriptional regulator [Caulobacter sp.]